MPDPASLTASLAKPGIAPTSPLPVTPVERPNRYEVEQVQWGNHKRFVVRDTTTNTTIAIRAKSQIADSDLIRLNWAARHRPDPETALHTVVTDSPSELTADHPSQRQCGRCRQLFPGDAALNPAAIQDWWICEPCHHSLMGAGAPTGTGRVGPTAPPGHLPR